MWHQFEFYFEHLFNFYEETNFWSPSKRDLWKFNLPESAPDTNWAVHIRWTWLFPEIYLMFSLPGKCPEWHLQSQNVRKIARCFSACQKAASHKAAFVVTEAGRRGGNQTGSVNKMAQKRKTWQLVCGLNSLLRTADIKAWWKSGAPQTKQCQVCQRRSKHLPNYILRPMNYLFPVRIIFLPLAVFRTTQKSACCKTRANTFLRYRGLFFCFNYARCHGDHCQCGADPRGPTGALTSFTTFKHT